MASAAKPTKNQLRRAKKKAAKQDAVCDVPDLHSSKRLTQQTQTTSEQQQDGGAVGEEAKSIKEESTSMPPDSTEPLVADEIDFDNMKEDDPLYDMYKSVMEKFQQVDKEDPSTKDIEKPEVFYDDDEDIPDEEEDGEQKLSKKKRKQMNKLSVAELKALVQKPEIVDWTDTSAPDPRLLVHIKSTRNVVPVPPHWSLKREYLSSKRGIEKPPFALPKFIQETGIAEMRDAVLDKQNEQTLKQKQRERVQGKLGKLDIDYQKLYEAFFRFQTKPELTRYGEVYYEGKEYETNLKHLRPGELSDELKEALSIPPGAPPPWLINQQRFGPPPSYPALKIPGLNAPPPPGGQWGFHPGGYGKPPVDDFNRPLYGGDVFGFIQAQANPPVGEPVEKSLWGELQEAEESEEEEDSDDEEEGEDEDEDEGGTEDPSGLETPGGMASVVPSEAGGQETISGEFNLRKQRRGTETEESPYGRSAFHVAPVEQAQVEGFIGSERRYDLKGAPPPNVPMLGDEDSLKKRKKPGDVHISMDPDALIAKDAKGGMDKQELEKEFERQRQQESNPWGAHEDLSEMIATESRKRQKIDEKNRGRR